MNVILDNESAYALCIIQTILDILRSIDEHVQHFNEINEIGFPLITAAIEASLYDNKSQMILDGDILKTVYKENSL